VDNKITKKRISVHLEYDWLKYLAIVAAAILLWSLVFTMTKPRLKIFEEIKFLCLTEGALYPLSAGLNGDGQDAKDGLIPELTEYFADEARRAEQERPIVQNVSWESLNPADPEVQMVITVRLAADNYDFILAEEAEFLPVKIEEDKPEETDAGYLSAMADLSRWGAEDAFSYENFGAAAGFADADGYEAAKFYPRTAGMAEGERGEAFRGFKLNALPEISRLFPDMAASEKTYVICVLRNGGNIGNLNEPQKKYDASARNEAYDALGFFLARYNGDR
jgi:hypothetical protein